MTVVYSFELQMHVCRETLTPSPSPSFPLADNRFGHASNALKLPEMLVETDWGIRSQAEDEDEENTDIKLKKKVDEALEACKLPKERCALLNVSKYSGLQYTYCLPRDTKKDTVSRIDLLLWLIAPELLLSV